MKEDPQLDTNGQVSELSIQMQSKKLLVWNYVL